MMKIQPYIVIDHNIPEFWQNRILDRAYMSQFPGATVLTDLAEAAQEAGYQVMTADVYLSDPAYSDMVFVMTEIGSSNTDELMRRGLIPAIITCAESPIIANDFYHDLAHQAGRYEHAFLFGGTATRLQGTETRFHPFFWPNSLRQVQAGKPWPQRSFITLINSNKRAFQFKLGRITLRHPRSSLWSIYHYLLSLYIHQFDPWMRTDLYLERLRAIKHFSHNPDFDLYGQGWNNPVPGVDEQFLESIRKCYRGTIPAGTDKKLDVLQNYKFVVCFENTIFPGYITEKLFDCFFAGCIPIYYGAPDITDHVPLNSFIDFRNFKSYKDLEKYLRTMDMNKADGYLRAAADFLASTSFDKFCASNFIDRILLVLNEIMKRHV